MSVKVCSHLSNQVGKWYQVASGRQKYGRKVRENVGIFGGGFLIFFYLNIIYLTTIAHNLYWPQGTLVQQQMHTIFKNKFHIYIQYVFTQTIRIFFPNFPYSISNFHVYSTYYLQCLQINSGCRLHYVFTFSCEK